jgi:hypothetical protein
MLNALDAIPSSQLHERGIHIGVADTQPTCDLTGRHASARIAKGRDDLIGDRDPSDAATSHGRQLMT